MIQARYSGKAMSARFRQRAERITPILLKAQQENARVLKARAVLLSSGPLKTKEQRRIARLINNNKGLYSTASPVAVAPWVINSQTGYLSRRWQTAFVWQGRDMQITVYNTAPYAKYLFVGTRKAIARLLLQKVWEQEGPACSRHTRQAMRSIYK